MAPESTLYSLRRALLLTLLYALVVAALAWRHELWRDEVRALNIAAGSASLADLLRNLRNEGHPALWYLLLHAGHRLTGSLLCLKPISLLIACAGVYVFLRRAPLRPLHKVLFCAGLFPLHEYSVMCRNYGISMLLLFLFAAAAAARDAPRRPLVLALALLLSLLCNTNAHSLILAVALAAGLVAEGALHPSARPRGPVALPAAIFLAGLLFSAWVIYPDRSTGVTGLHDRSAGDAALALIHAFLWPTRFLALDAGPTAPAAAQLVFALGNGALSALLWVTALSLLRRPWLALSLVAAALGYSLFTELIYPCSTRHRGLFLVFVLVLLWLDRAAGDTGALELPRGSLLRRAQEAAARGREAGLTVLLAMLVLGGAYFAGRDLVRPFSSSERLGALLRGAPELREAVVVGEPDYLLEALPYYAPNRVYQPREGRYLFKVSFTSASRRTLSLDALMETAARLRRETGRQVVLVLGHPLAPGGPFVLPVGYAQEFVYNAASLRRFLARAGLIARLDGAETDENYDLYLWRGE